MRVGKQVVTVNEMWWRVCWLSWRVVGGCCEGLGGCFRLCDGDFVHGARLAARHVVHVSRSCSELARSQSAKSSHVGRQNQRYSSCFPPRTEDHSVPVVVLWCDLTMNCALSTCPSLNAVMSPCTGCYKPILLTLYGGLAAAMWWCHLNNIHFYYYYYYYYYYSAKL